MFVMTRTMVIEKGNSDKVIARFSQEGAIDQMEGLVDISVMVNRKSQEQEEVVVVIRWESQEAWKNWEKATHTSKAIKITAESSRLLTSSARR